METTPDNLRLLALHILNRAKELTPTSVSPQEAVVRAYNESCGDFQKGLEAELHPITDQWITAHHLALGALHEASLDPRISPTSQIDYAQATLEMLIEADKLSV